MIRRFLFPNYDNANTAYSLFLLFARIIFGGFFLLHGIEKMINYDQLSAIFPDPLGTGHEISLMLAIFAELFCSLAFICGFLYRLALLPMIFTMGMAFFKIHAADPFAVKEPALIYMLVFIFLYITGPGKYALDYFISNSKPATPPAL